MTFFEDGTPSTSACVFLVSDGPEGPCVVFCTTISNDPGGLLPFLHGPVTRKDMGGWAAALRMAEESYPAMARQLREEGPQCLMSADRTVSAFWTRMADLALDSVTPAHRYQVTTWSLETILKLGPRNPAWNAMFPAHKAILWDSLVPKLQAATAAV